MSQDILQRQFAEICKLITQSRQKAYQAVNTTLIDLYWQVGKYISEKISCAEWGEAVVVHLANYLHKTQPSLRGFTKSNLFRMRQFYEIYHEDIKVAPLARQLTWTNNQIIIGRSKRKEEREFYLKMAVQERWGKRELNRQFDAALFERAVLTPPKMSKALAEHYPKAFSCFKDAYSLEFLGLSDNHAESDLHKALLNKLKSFLIELGRDFCFIASEYALQVGKRDFSVDLLFFHRGLNCLVAFELKVGDFDPGHLGQLSFYLEALDQKIKKPHEEPSIGILLCAGKDDEVVEFALNRTLSPALITEYTTQLPDKELLQSKLHEFYHENMARNAIATGP